MTRFIKREWPILLVVLLLLPFYFWNLLQVPFHPDESTQIFMSRNAPILFSDPLSLSWEPDEPRTLESRYLAIDAPLTRYLIGIGRSIFKVPALTSDWDWSASWQSNVSSGAYPSTNQLYISRAMTTLLVPFSLFLLYCSLKKLFPQKTSLIAVIILGLHPLLLLHARRAMAESALLFGVVFFLWATSQENRKPALIGVALAVAINAKQTAIALLPVGIIAVCWLPIYNRNLRKMLTRIAKLLSVFLIATFLLNPFYWKYPIKAAQVSYIERQTLTQRQVQDYYSESSPDNQSIITRILAQLTNLFIYPPSTEEFGNYLTETEASKLNYFSFPFNSWGQGFFSGFLLLTLTISGFLVSLRRYSSYSNHQKSVVWILYLTTMSIAILVIFLLPLPIQRYIVPLLPLEVIWIGFCLSPIIEYLTQLLKQNISKRTTT